MGGIDTREMSESALRAISLKLEYRTGDDDLANDFFAPCLAAAHEYDRAVGYFRSSVFLVAGPYLLDFAKRGGKLRLVCSPELDAEDIEALTRGYAEREVTVANALLREISELLDRVDTRDRIVALATMIAVGAMDVRIAFRASGVGIFHEKLGIFRDARQDSVSFKGSSNETWSGWSDRGNFESFEVFCSWTSALDAARIARHQAYFERLWTGSLHEVQTIPFPDAPAERLRQVAKRTLEDITLFPQSASRKRTPLPHQSLAIQNWEGQGKRGILQHATGSGKTFTALTALRDHLGADGTALVLVPSRLLLKQWADEIERELPAVALLLVGGGNSLWRRKGRLESFTSPASGLGPRVVLATMQTGSKSEFRARVYGGQHLMVVVDEVHKAGSPQHSGVFQILSGPRLGLSATPVRFGDPAGTDAIFRYFVGVVPPPFTLEDAIAAGRLVPYEYFPHRVRLNADEEEQWSDLTRTINREVAMQLSGSDRQSLVLNDRLKLLLIKRARIVKKAVAKIDLAREVISEVYREGQHWLVYCEDSEQLHAVSAELAAAGLPTLEYFTAMDGAPDETLQWFRRFGGILVSIRCLDEGVDIPQTSHALILASSQNPREFIQRRGRVLRATPDRLQKQLAAVHDALVIPEGLAMEADATAIVRTEMARALEFARSALNRSAEADLMEWMVEVGMDPDVPLTVGVEAEEGDDDEG